MSVESEVQPQSAPRRRTLRPLAIVRDSLVIYREHWWRLIVSAIVVFTPLAVVDALLEEIHSEHVVIKVLLQIASGVLELLGAVLYAGLVTAAVIAWRAGGRHEGPLKVARHLPWRTISALDLLIPLIIVVGIIALVVPGILAAVYLSLAPAFAEIDHTGIKESLRRSIRAVRGSFWRVLAVYLVLVVLAGILQQMLQDAVDHTVGHIASVILVQAIFAPFYGLAVATITFDRRDADPSLAGPRLDRATAG
jgi:hypothetical protein